MRITVGYAPIFKTIKKIIFRMSCPAYFQLSIEIE